jgi:hypothetical protein
MPLKVNLGAKKKCENSKKELRPSAKRIPHPLLAEIEV